VLSSTGEATKKGRAHKSAALFASRGCARFPPAVPIGDSLTVVTSPCRPGSRGRAGGTPPRRKGVSDVATPHRLAARSRRSAALPAPVARPRHGSAEEPVGQDERPRGGGAETRRS